MFRKIVKKVFALALAIALVMPVVSYAQEYGSAKNVIVMIPDGMNVESYTFARYFTNNYKHTLDQMNTGTVRTNNSNTPIADSAPAGTAMATGYKSESPYVGTYPSKAGMPGAEGFDLSKAQYPLATVLEGAKSQGRATGIVSTSNVNHATPADFSAHHPSRSEYQKLIEQQVYQDMDVVLGAGSSYLSADKRDDGQDLIKEIKNLGYDYVTTKDQMKSSSSNKIWGMFDPKSMSYDLDRKAEEPSLAEMTKKAIDILSREDKGFFLMVEGSEIDWAGHANDPVAMVGDILAFDEAVKVAKDFADTNKDTVIVVATDHGTGGMTIGNAKSAKNYDKIPLGDFTKHIKGARVTALGAARLLNEGKTNVADVMSQEFGINDLTAEEIKSVQESKDTQKAIGTIISDRSYIGWTTGGHVGGDVGLYCYSTADNAKLLTGNIHNNQIGRYLEDILDVDLDNLSDRLFVPLKEAEAKGAEIKVVESENKDINATITKGNQKIEIPVYKNYVINNGTKVDLPGVTVHNGNEVFVPQEVIDLIK